MIWNRLAELARTSKQLAGRPRRADNQPRTTINIPVELPDLLTHFRIAAREGTSLPPLTPEDASARRSFHRRPLADVTSDLGIQSSGRWEGGGARLQARASAGRDCQPNMRPPPVQPLSG